MILEKDGAVYHDEHNCTVKISNDNTKHLKTVTVIIRSDGDPKTALAKANELWEKAL